MNTSSFTFNSSTMTQQQQQQQQQQQGALLIPLLGDEEEQYSCYNVVNQSSAEDTVEKPAVDNNNDENQFFNQVDNIYFVICMPLFLFIQFGFAFSIHQQDNETTTTTMPTSVAWSTVKWNICLFVMTVWVYRWACIDSCIANWFLLLLPEITTNIVLAILVFDIHKIAAAFVVLMVGIRLMSLLAVVATIHYLYTIIRNKNSNVEAKEEEEEEDGEEHAYISMEKQAGILLV